MSRATDNVIKEYIVRRLSEDSHLDASHIYVKVDQGVVQLEGHVPESVQISRAGKAALNAPGVARVLNEIRSLLPQSDTPLYRIAVRSRLLSAILLSPEMDVDDVDVAFVDGDLIVSGTVPTQWHKAQVRNIAIKHADGHTVRDRTRVAADDV